ncbi:hypothetical protein GCM10025866_01270 [Naasia aerilata]|uniref:Uncharacterized protein n=1 Tax=Naasia aerilata TaxID=1162966 RepID=A0ABM8G7S2_9MICO|nr:hypothetical protein GCM10025866_01270 [Naasia aerilata]
MAEAVAQLGDSIDVYLDGGSTPGSVPSTIVDATGLADGSGRLRVVRSGVLDDARLRKVVGDLLEGPQQGRAQP